MKNYKKGFVIPLIIAIIALLGVGGGAYVYVNKKITNKSKTPQEKILQNQESTTGTSSVKINENPKEELTQNTNNAINTQIPTTVTTTIKLKTGTKTIIKTATSTTSIFVGIDGSKSTLVTSKEEEEDLRKNTTYACGNEKCFAESFRSCSPTSVSTIDNLFLVSVYYEIKGGTQNGCSLAFKYTRHPSPDWVEKEMICTVDNKLDFQSATEEMFSLVTSGDLKCTGPLYDIFKPKETRY